MKRHHVNRLKLAGFVIGVALFVWLRWYSAIWQNRWVGFGLGLACLVTPLSSRGSLKRWRESARSLDSSRPVVILLAITITWMSASALKGFFGGGPPFLFSSGIRARSDDGFFGGLLCSAALQWLYACWIMLRKRSDRSSNPVVPQQHG